MHLHRNTVALLVIGLIMTVAMWLASANVAATAVIGVTTVAGAAFVEWALSRR
ncbi:hypothetical protein [uncultured Corynebacterium sp.]|uniref:hypothetical protein n=1 Tax=uncultured Corynebacterium sp. TaxID=159447 RepID=UPI0025F6D62D|nr:hypothetical protein [uncultured Corynebacterium sp.]